MKKIRLIIKREGDIAAFTCFITKTGSNGWIHVVNNPLVDLVGEWVNTNCKKIEVYYV